jgi:hypothetical protein
MILQGKLAVGILDLVLGGGLRNAQNLVVISLARHMLYRQTGDALDRPKGCFGYFTL